MSRPLSNPVPAVAALLLLVSAGACQALAGLSSLEIDASGSGGDLAASSSAVTGSTATTTSSSSASTGDASSASSSAASAGGGEGGDGGQGGDGTTSGGGQGGVGGGGGTGGAGGDDGGGGTGGRGGGGGQGGGGTCNTQGDCAGADVCLQQCEPGSCDPGTCEVCGGDYTGPRESCPGYCMGGTCDPRCTFSCNGGEPPCSPDGLNASMKTSSGNMQLVCGTKPCNDRTARCNDDPGTPAGSPDRGPFDCKMRCEAALACDGATLDCTSHNGECILDCMPGACPDTTVICGFNRCTVLGADAGGNSVTVLQSTTACELDAPGAIIP